jgi:2',3'-cyclic-nucleotide 2'-phosphodiesterase (5'-nucleotidase family)
VLLFYTGRRMRRSYSKDEVVSAISELAEKGNLAAVLIHLNDTYLIEERKESGIPGMARIAGLIHTVREVVKSKLGEDRTLVLHSGDYLSPSALSSKFHGAQMVELLNHCTVNYATLGNHEFDFGEQVLCDRLREARFTTLLANLRPPTGKDLPIRGTILWPERDPFMLLTGLAGEQTLTKAEGCGFERLDTDEEVENILEMVHLKPQLGALTVLSHMAMDEDLKLQALLNSKWRRRGFVYVLGGHDHDISWPQGNQQSILSKCFSNCKSVTMFLIPKDGVSAPSLFDVPFDPVPGPTIAELMRHAADPHAAIEAAMSDPRRTRNCEDVIRVYRNICPVEMRKDFQEAFEKRIREAFASFPTTVIRDCVLDRWLSRATIGDAIAYSLPSFWDGRVEIFHSEHLASWPSHVPAATCVQDRLALMSYCAKEELVADFARDISDRLMDVTDKELRWHSTDFGNFVADALKASTGADMALINAGSFRFDGFTSARITVGDLRDVFLYDLSDNTVVVVELTSREVQSIYDHALKTKGGHGGFLQVSDPQENIPKLHDSLKVALIRHMLADNEDGFQSIIAESRGLRKEDLLQALGDDSLPHGRLIELIRAGAGTNIPYCNSLRIQAQKPHTALEMAAKDLVALVDYYRTASMSANLKEWEALQLLEARADLSRIGSFPSLASSRKAICDFTLSILLEKIDGVRYMDLYEYLMGSRYRWSNDVRYQDFLDFAGRFQ